MMLAQPNCHAASGWRPFLQSKKIKKSIHERKREAESQRKMQNTELTQDSAQKNSSQSWDAHAGQWKFNSGRAQVPDQFEIMPIYSKGCKPHISNRS